MNTPSPMEFQIEPAGPCRKKVTVKIPPTRVTEEFDKSYRNLIKTVPIPGFRQGKAPRKLVEKRFGEQVAQEVRQALLDAAFEEALSKNQLSPITDPELDLEKIKVHPAEELGFDFTVTVKPEFDLPDLKGIEVSVPPAIATDAQVKAAIEALRRRKATLRPLEKGKVAEGDVVSLKVTGKAGDEEVFRDDELPYEVGSSYLGGLVVADLDEALIGKGSGDQVAGKGMVPPHADQHPLAGMEISLEAEVVEVKRPELPKLDQALARSLDYESVDEMEASVRRELQARIERDRERAIEEAALDQLITKTTFDLPEDLIRKEVEDLSRRTAYEMQMQGKTEEEIAQRIAEIRARRSEESVREMKSFFVLDRLVEKERILVTETEVRNAVSMIAAYNQKSPEQMYAALRDSGRLSSLRNQLRENKARARLRSKVKVLDAAAGAAPAAEAGATAKKPARKGGTKKKES